MIIPVILWEEYTPPPSTSCVFTSILKNVAENKIFSDVYVRYNSQ
jgi:hypothetical protein